MLQAFIARYPQVEVAVTAGTSPGLRRQYDAGELDLVTGGDAWQFQWPLTQA
jgi:DNA-binding transcriptional LysR family regulator